MLQGKCWYAMAECKASFTILLGLLLLCCRITAQENNPLKLEFSVPKDESEFQSVSAQENGVFVFHAKSLPDSNSNLWVINYYNVDLQIVHTKEIILPYIANYRFGEFYQDKLYLWFQDKFQRKTSPQSYLLIIDTQKDTLIRQDIPAMFNLQINFMKHIDNQIILISYNKNEYMIYLYNTETQQLRLHPCSELNFSAIDFCEIDTVAQCIYWGGILRESNSSNETMHLIITDKQGNILQKLPYPRHPSYAFNSTRIAVYDSAKAVIIGTYTQKEVKLKSHLHTGVYTIKYENAHLSEPDFFSYTLISTNHNKSKNKTNNNLEMLVGPLFFFQNQLCLISEVYYPEYSTSYYHDNAYWYGSRTTPITTFEGYRYENAFITAFDTNGQLLWNYYLPFSQVLQKTVSAKINIATFGTSNIVYYLHQGQLTYTILEGNQVIEPLNSFRLSSGNLKEVTGTSIDSKLQKWYGNYYLATGYQLIKNNSNNKISDRYVYYVRKMEFR
jgi:hypothetical protein